MFVGILIGLFIILNQYRSQQNKSIEALHELISPKPEISMNKRNSLKDLITVWKAKRRIYALMNKDSLSKRDSLEIKAIDQQLNQLIHD